MSRRASVLEPGAHAVQPFWCPPSCLVCLMTTRFTPATAPSLIGRPARPRRCVIGVTPRMIESKDQDVAKGGNKSKALTQAMLMGDGDQKAFNDQRRREAGRAQNKPMQVRPPNAAMPHAALQPPPLRPHAQCSV